jgi:phospholipase C
MGMEKIEHVVVVMMENRSFDNLLGWLYDNGSNRPAVNIPPQTPPTFDGLAVEAHSNTFHGPPVFASRPPTAWPTAADPMVVPTPDPHEEFDHITAQIFGTSIPAPGKQPDMSGFLADYATTSAGAEGAAQIMQSFGPAEAPVINTLARSFAVSDRWFASVPAQTWPNRGFVHSGSSDGHINNDNYELYDIPTIFSVLQSLGKSWGVFADATLIPSLTRGQFLPRLFLLPGHFQHYKVFKTLCQAGATAPVAAKLPQYSFIEPRFVPELGSLATVGYPSDYHPPHDVGRGDAFLADVYQAVRSSPYRDRILLVITFDEHGGCYDHVPPPSGAAAPQPWPRSRDGRFDFSRFGVRVPAIVISSYVRPGTVFRASPGEAPYDHTSILATLRDWLQLDSDPAHLFLPSPRIKAAPTLDRVLTLGETEKNTNWPEIVPSRVAGANDQSLDTPLNDVQKSLLATATRMQSGQVPQAAAAASAAAALDAARQAKALRTYRDAVDFLRQGPTSRSGA